MSCLYVMARDTRNLMFLDNKFYMFGENYLTIKNGSQETAFIMMLERSLFVTSGMKRHTKYFFFAKQLF